MTEPGSQGGRDATALCRRDHRLMAMMVDVLRAVVSRWEAGEAPAIADLPETARFFIIFADQLHHAREEQVLFPALLARDAAREPLIAQLLQEHAYGRACLEELLEGLAWGERDRSYRAVQDYLRFIGEHMRCEETLLLPALDACLDADAQRQLADEMTTRAPSTPEVVAITNGRQLAARYLPGRDM